MKGFKCMTAHNTKPVMEETQFLKANILWEKGEMVAINPDNHNTLYIYDNCFFVIWYNADNTIKTVERVSEEQATSLFNPGEWRLV